MPSPDLAPLGQQQLLPPGLRLYTMSVTVAFISTSAARKLRARPSWPVWRRRMLPASSYFPSLVFIRHGSSLTEVFISKPHASFLAGY